MTRLRFATNARADLIEIAEFIEAEAGKVSAGRVVASVRRTCKYLAEMPAAGRPRPELAPHLRSFVSVEYSYVILYRPAPGAVEIVAVVHGARDIDRVMGRRSD